MTQDVVTLGPNRYGKSAIRVVRLDRADPERQVVRDLTVDIALEGDFGAAHVEGDNALVVPTDTMKNTVYAFARDRLDAATPIERFGSALASHFLDFAQVASSQVTLREHAWTRLEGAHGPVGDAFARTGGGTRVAVVVARHDDVEVEAGIEDLVVMKTSRSAFEGFPRDRFTTLADASDRIMATKVTAAWRYGPEAGEALFDLDRAFADVHRTLLQVFADHHSPSVQASIWLIGRAVLERHAFVTEVRMRLPNLHHWLVDLAPFGLDNPGEVFVATTEPHGLIEATVRRET